MVFFASVLIKNKLINEPQRICFKRGKRPYTMQVGHIRHFIHFVNKS